MECSLCRSVLHRIIATNYTYYAEEKENLCWKQGCEILRFSAVLPLLNIQYILK